MRIFLCCLKDQQPSPGVQQEEGAYSILNKKVVKGILQIPLVVYVP